MANIENVNAKRFESVNLLQRCKPKQQNIKKNCTDFSMLPIKTERKTKCFFRHILIGIG